MDQQNAVADAKANALPTNLGGAEEMKVSPDLFGQYEKNKANMEALENESDDDDDDDVIESMPKRANLGERRGSRFDLNKEEAKGDEDQ